jgi:hypothetical protein
VKALFSIAFALFAMSALSQATIAPIGDLWLQGNKADQRSHPGIQPAIRQPDTSKTYGIDLLKGTARGNNYLKLNFAPDSYVSVGDTLTYRAAAGFSLESQLNGRFYMRMAVSSGYGSGESSFQTHSFVTCDPLTRGQFYTDVRARLGWTPNKMLHLAAGIDNQFFGEGARSLIQGDQCAPSPFAMMRVNFKSLEYGLLYQSLREAAPVSGVLKFSATHYLSWNVTRNWNIAAFENILFSPRDTIYKRGFELEYLNPVVFFRPQEYSLGSSDNAFLALQTSVSLKKATMYGQLALDEFDINEIRNKTKWWASKFAAQLGVKGKAGKKAGYRLECNVVRPFTYSHVSARQNMGNLGRPLAHISGANFAELLAELHIQSGQFGYKAYGVFLLKGYDPDSISYGGDIYRSYTERASDYGHYIGQGTTVRSINAGIEASWLIKAISSRVYVNPGIAGSWGDTGSSIDLYISAGVRSELFGVRRRF